MSRTIVNSTGGDTTCNCVRGQAHIINGVCGCDDVVPVPVIPPMPTSHLGNGWVWQYVNGAWRPVRSSVPNPLPQGLPVVAGNPLMSFYQTHKTLSLIILAGSLYFLTKGK